MFSAVFDYMLGIILNTNANANDSHVDYHISFGIDGCHRRDVLYE